MVCTENPGYVKFCFSDRGNHGLCFLFKCHCNRAVGWAMQFPVCPGKFPWLGRLNSFIAGLSISFPTWTRQEKQLQVHLSVVLTQVPWLDRATGFALEANSSAHLPLSSRVSRLHGSRCSYQPFLSGQAGNHALQQVGLCLWLLPGPSWEDPLQATPKYSPRGFLVRRGQ